MSSEVYPRAPVQFVAFTTNFPLSPRLQRQETQEAVYERLADRFPLLDIVEAVQLPISIGETQLGQVPPVPQKLRMMNRERTRSVTIGPRMISVQCTDHESFAKLRELLAPVLAALVDVAEPSAMSRVALQYIDEIRHPSVKNAGDWKGLLRDSLVGPVDLLDMDAQQTSAITVYRLTDAHEVRLVHGAAPEGFAVDPAGPLRVMAADGGPFFRLDIASEWTAPNETIPPFSVQEVLRVADELHSPIRQVFENAITEKLRAHFRGNDGNSTS